MSQLPGILLIGAQKSGTTSLHHLLTSHPEIAPPICSLQQQWNKEVHFFDNYWDKGVDWYRSHFPKAQRLYIDSTPDYIAVPIVHKRMKSIVPEVKIIITLRNPVERCYSQYNHYKQCLPESEYWHWHCPGNDFATNIKKELQTLTKFKDHYQYPIRRGFYAEQIEHLFQYYPKEQVYIMILERWSNNIKFYLHKLWSFLDISTIHSIKKEERYHMREKTVERMNKTIRDSLYQIYKEPNQHLFELLGYEIPEWSDRNSS